MALFEIVQSPIMTDDPNLIIQYQKDATKKEMFQDSKTVNVANKVSYEKFGHSIIIQCTICIEDYIIPRNKLRHL